MLTSENIRQCDASAWTAEGRLKGQHFQPRSTDIIVAGGFKSGTTWLQQIIHQLSTGGDMDFEDIGHVVYLLRVKGSMKEREDRCLS